MPPKTALFSSLLHSSSGILFEVSPFSPGKRALPLIKPRAVQLRYTVLGPAEAKHVCVYWLRETFFASNRMFGTCSFKFLKSLIFQVQFAEQNLRSLRGTGSFFKSSSCDSAQNRRALFPVIFVPMTFSRASSLPLSIFLSVRTSPDLSRCERTSEPAFLLDACNTCAL